MLISFSKKLVIIARKLEKNIELLFTYYLNVILIKYKKLLEIKKHKIKAHCLYKYGH
jgi:hypothetical protein